MNAYDAAASAALAALGIGIPLILYWWMRDSLRSVFTEVFGATAPTVLCVRIFLLLMVAVGVRCLSWPPPRPHWLNASADWHFMEYVWAVAARLAGSLVGASLALALIMVAAAVLASIPARRKWNTKGY